MLITPKKTVTFEADADVVREMESLKSRAEERGLALDFEGELAKRLKGMNAKALRLLIQSSEESEGGGDDDAAD